VILEIPLIQNQNGARMFKFMKNKLGNIYLKMNMVILLEFKMISKPQLDRPLRYLSGLVLVFIWFDHTKSLKKKPFSSLF